MLRSEETRKAIEFIEKWAESEKGPFNTAWPFDVLLSHIRSLEQSNDFWDNKRWIEIQISRALEEVRDKIKEADLQLEEMLKPKE